MGLCMKTLFCKNKQIACIYNSNILIQFRGQLSLRPQRQIGFYALIMLISKIQFLDIHLIQNQIQFLNVLNGFSFISAVTSKTGNLYDFVCLIYYLIARLSFSEVIPKRKIPEAKLFNDNCLLVNCAASLTCRIEQGKQILKI